MKKLLDNNEVFKILKPYFESYVKGYYEYRQEPLCNGLEVLSTWINRQKKNEFNPPHIHDGDLSFVLYTEIPEELEKECHSSVASSPGPGCITFDFNMPRSQGAMKLIFTNTFSFTICWRFIYFPCRFTTLGLSFYKNRR